MNDLGLSRRDTLGLLVTSAGSLAAPRFVGAAAAVDIADLARRVSGAVIARGGDGYETARRALSWNARVAPRMPEAIVRAASAQDVAATVRFARANGLRVAVRGGGHHYHGTALRDGSIAVDLSQLAALEISAERRTASAGPAVKGGALSTALARHDLAFPTGHCADVSLSGYLLNGGLGWNFGQWGISCDSVHGIEVVTADGEIVYADRDHEPDLFWAAGGAGSGFFGVVTRYDLDLVPRPRAIHTVAASFDLDALPAVADWLARAIPDVHEHVEVITSLGPDPEGRLTVSILAIGFGADAAQARAKVAALASTPRGVPVLGEVLDAPSSLDDLYAAVAAGFPVTRMSGDFMVHTAPIAELLRAVAPLAAEAPGAPSAIAVFSLGKGAALPRSERAFSLSGTGMLGAYAFWPDSRDDDRNAGWVQRVMRVADTHAAGYYVGETDLLASPDRARRCFSRASWQRLVDLRRRFDPDDVFGSFLATA